MNQWRGRRFILKMGLPALRRDGQEVNVLQQTSREAHSCCAKLSGGGTKNGRKMVSSGHFRQELHAQLDRAATRGQKHIVINALELRFAAVFFTGPKHRTLSDVMESERKPGDVLLAERDSAAGLTIRYLLPRSA